MELLTVKEIADLLKVNKVTIQRWCNEGEIPSVKIGKSYRVEKDDFEEWFESKRKIV